MEDRTEAQRTHDYMAMGHSIVLIDGIIAGDLMVDKSPEDRNHTVERNVKHLESMVSKTDWDNVDFTDANSAISAGNGYTAS
tara:strand:- start:45 stop:290 length:246 start_codon:yes stop_codon:yes gene_type:complete